MLFMVIERFVGGAEAIYKRFEEKGRMLPEGLRYVDSWVERNLERCFQLMETDRPELIDEWIENWQDLVAFEVIPVGKTSDAVTRVGTSSDRVITEIDNAK